MITLVRLCQTNLASGRMTENLRGSWHLTCGQTVSFVRGMTDSVTSVSGCVIRDRPRLQSVWSVTNKRPCLAVKSCCETKQNVQAVSHNGRLGQSKLLSRRLSPPDGHTRCFIWSRRLHSTINLIACISTGTCMLSRRDGHPSTTVWLDSRKKRMRGLTGRSAWTFMSDCRTRLRRQPPVV